MSEHSFRIQVTVDIPANVVEARGNVTEPMCDVLVQHAQHVYNEEFLEGRDGIDSNGEHTTPDGARVRWQALGWHNGD